MSVRGDFMPIADEASAQVHAALKPLLDREPLHPERPIAFSHSDYDRRPFTLRRFLAPARGGLVVAVILIVLEALAQQAGPLLVKIGIDRGLPAADGGSGGGDLTVLVVVFVLYVVAIGLNTLATWGKIRWTGRVGEALLAGLRVRIFSHLQRLSLAFFEREKAGRLLTRMTSDLEALTTLLQEGFAAILLHALNLVIVTTVLLTLNLRLALVTLLVLVPAMFVATLWFQRASERGYGAVRDRVAEVMAHLQESLSGVRTVAAFNRRRRNVAHHRQVVGAYRDANDHMARTNGIYTPGAEFLGVLAQAAVLLVGGAMVANGTATLGVVVAFVLYLTQFFAPIQQLVQLYDAYQRGQAAVAKLRDLFATEPTVVEAPDATDLPALAGEIRVEGVSFGYDPDHAVLHDIDLVVPAGETLAIVGATGSGKSTLAKLITRWYDPNAGRVLLDGHDLRRATFTSLRSQIAVVPQEAFLFAGSIRDNLVFARRDATDEQVWAACDAVGLRDLVTRLPEGLDTPCHERGVALSAGERQLLALARAFLAQPRVLVLDEATSSLDLASEALIERALDTVLEGRTAVVIAHRLATAMRADRIAVMDAGRIVELGSHAELVAQGGVYATMFATWQSHAGMADVRSG